MQQGLQLQLLQQHIREQEQILLQVSVIKNLWAIQLRDPVLVVPLFSVQIHHIEAQGLIVVRIIHHHDQEHQQLELILLRDHQVEVIRLQEHLVLHQVALLIHLQEGHPQAVLPIHLHELLQVVHLILHRGVLHQVDHPILLHGVHRLHQAHVHRVQVADHVDKTLEVS